MPNPTVDLAELATLVQTQTDAVQVFLDQFIAMITSNQNTVVVKDAQGNDVTVPTWSAISGTNAGQISSLITQVATLQGTVTSAQTAITSLQTSRTADEANVTANTTAIATLTTALTAAQDALATMTTTVSGIQVTQGTDEGDIATLTTGLAAAAASITTLTSQVGTLLTAVAQLQTNTATLAVKADVSLTTDGSAQYVGFLVMGKLSLLTHMTTSVAARVRLYATAADRDADLARLVSVPATVNQGVLFEGTTTGGQLSFMIGPSCMLHNSDGPQSNKVYCTIEPTAGAVAVTVALTRWLFQA